MRAGYRRSSIARQLWKTTALTSLTLALSGVAAYGDDAGLWQPQVRAIIGADNNGGNAALEGFIPIKQTAESVLFLDVRAKHDFKDAFGQDIGLGIRRIVNPDLMLGGYAYFNAESYGGTQFTGGTLGVEAITPNFDAHVNVFVPIKGDSTSHSTSSTLSMVSNQLIEQISVLDHRDYAAWGIEGEVGAKVPLNLPDRHSLRLDIGGYHFEDPHGDDGSVTGAKAGVEYEIGDVFGTGTSLTFTGEVRNDNRDDTQFAGSVRLNIPFNPGGGSDSTAAIGADPVYPVSEGLRKRVNERVRGDIGVRIQSQDKTGGTTTRVAINAATNAAFGKFYFADGGLAGAGTQADPTTLDDAVTKAGNGGFVVALGGNGNLTTAGVTLATGQTVIGGGESVTAKLFGGGTATFNLGGSDGTIQGTNVANPVITLGNGNTLNGITITGGGDGIFGSGVSATLTKVTVTGTGGNGADFTGNSTSVSASNFTTTGNGLDGLHIEGDGTYNFTGTTLLSGNQDDGLDITGKGTYSFAILNAQDNQDAGITVKGTAVGGSFTTTGGQVSGNKALGDDGVGIFIDPITAHVVLDSISQTGGTSGVVLDHVSGSFTVNGATTISNTTGPAIAISDSPATIRFGDINITAPGGDGMSFSGVNAAVVAGNIVISGLGLGHTGLDFSGQTTFTALSANISGSGAGSIGIDLADTTGGASIIITNGGTISGVDTGVRLGIAGSLAHSANAQFSFGGGSIAGVTASLDARGLNQTLGLYAFGSTTFSGPQLFDVQNVIFVGAAASGAGDGSSLGNLASIGTADGITDANAIFVLVNDAGNTPINASGGFSLSDDQTLASFGNGRSFSLGGVPINVTGTNIQHDQVVSDPGTGATTLTNSGAGDVVTLGNGNSLLDFNISGSSGAAIHGTGIAGLTVQGVSVGNVATGLFLNDVTGTVTVDDLHIQNASQTGIALVDSTATVNFTGNTTIANATSVAMFANNFDGTATFDDLDISGGGRGVAIWSGSSGTLTFGAASSITNTGDVAFNINNAAPNVTYSGTINQATAANAVRILGMTGGSATFGGKITASTGAANAIDLSGNAGGAINFTGGLDLTTDGGNGIDISGNSGSVTFGTTNVTLGATANTAGINFGGTNADVSFGTTSVTMGTGANQTAIDFSGSSTTADFGVTTITGTGEATSRGIDLSSTTGNKTITFLRGSSISDVHIGVDLSSGLSTLTSANANFTFGDGTSSDGLQSSISAAPGGYTVNTVGLDPTLGNYDFDDVAFTGSANLPSAVGAVTMVSQSGGVIAVGTYGLSQSVTTISLADADLMTGTQTFAFVGTVDLSATPFTLDSGQSITGFGNSNTIAVSGTFQQVNVQGNLGATGGNVTGDEGVVTGTADAMHLLGSNQVRNTAFDFTGASGSVFLIDQSAAGFDNTGGITIQGVTVSNVAVGQTAFKVDGLTSNVSIIDNSINVAGTLLDADGGNGNITLTRGNLPNGGPAGTLTGGGVSIANRTGGLVDFTDKATIGGNGVSLANNSGAGITFADLDVSTNGATAFTATGGGTITVDAGTINATGAQAAALDNVTADIHFTSTSATFSAGNGIDLQNLAGTAAFGTGALTNTGAGTSFNVGSTTAASGGTADISYGGTIASNGSGAAVSIQSMTGGSVTLSGNLTDTSAAAGGNIFVAGNDSTTITFSGTTKQISSGAADGVNLGLPGGWPLGTPTPNTNSAINFTNGGLAITTTTGAGFIAIGDLASSTFTVTGSGNKINSGGDGLLVNGADVGVGGVTFDSISAVSTSANGGGAGVFLWNMALAGNVNIGGLRDTGYIGASLSGLSGAGVVNFTGTTDLDTSNEGFEISGQVGTINIANVAGSTLTIDGSEVGIAFAVLQTGTVNVGGNGGVASIGATTSTTGSAISLSGGNDLINATLNYNGSIKVDTGSVLQASGDSTHLNMSGSVVSTTSSTAFDFFGHAEGIYDISSTIDHSGGKGVAIGGSANGTVTFSGTSKIFNTGANDAITKAPAYVPDPQTKGTLNFTNGGLVITTTSGAGFTASTFGSGTISVAGAGNTITTGTGTALKLGDATAILAGATGATIGVDGITFDTISANGATTGISLNDVSGSALSLGAVDLEGITSRGVDISGTLGSALGFTSLKVGLNAANAVGFDLNGAALGTSNITAGDFDVDGGSFAGTIGIDMAGTTGTGTIQLGDTVNNNPGPVGQTSTITNVGYGVQFSSATNAKLVFGDGQGPAESKIVTTGGQVIHATDTLPTAGDYNFNDVNFSGDTSNLSAISVYYVTADASALGDGSLLNPGTYANAQNSTANVIVLIDKNGTGSQETIELSGTSFQLDDGQVLLAFKSGDAAVDVSQLGVDTSSGASGVFHFTTVQNSPIISAPSGIDTLRPILQSNTATSVVNFATTGIGVLTGGIQNLIIRNTGSGTGVSGSVATASSFFLRNNDIAAGGRALDFTTSGAPAADRLLLSIDGNTLQSTGTALAANFLGQSVSATQNTIAIRSFANNTVIGGTGGGIAFNGATFDSTGGGGTVSAGTLTVGTTGARVQGDGLNLLNTSGTLDLGTSSIANNGGTGLLVNEKGGTTFTLNSSGGSVDTTNGTAINLDPLTVHMTLGSVTATGGASGIIFDGVAGTFAVTGATSITGTSGAGISAINTNAGTFNFNTVTVNNTTGGGIGWASGTLNVTGLANIDTTTGAGITQSGGTTGFTGGLTVDTTAGTALTGTAGTITIAATPGSETLNSTGGQAISLSGVAANIALDSTSSGGGFNNASLTNVSGTVGLGSGALSGATGASFLVSGGSVNATYAGNISQATAAQALLLVSGAHTGTLTFNTGTLSATNGTGLQFSNADGTYNFNGTTTLNGGTANINILTGSGGTFSFGTGTSITNTTGTAMNVSGGTANVTYSGNITQGGSGAMVNVSTHSVGTLTFQTGTLSASNGTGLQFSNADGTYNFNGTTTLNGGDAGIDIVTSSDGAFSFGAGTSITNPTGVGFNANGGAGNITYAGTISKNNANNIVTIQNRTGGTTTLSGTLTATGATSNGILVNANTGGTINFSGAGKSLTTGTNTAVNLTNNTNATINFTGGGLVINTTGGTGFNATGGGTVTVQGSGNTITSTTGTALDVENTNIGSGNLVFQSITSNGGSANGIILVNTGTAAGNGGLHVTGTGSAGSGGTIANKTGADGSATQGTGIFLNGTKGVQLAWMQLNDFGNFAIRGNNVTGFSLDHSVISGDSGSSNSQSDALASFANVGEDAIRLTNLLGSGSITNSNISGGYTNTIMVENNTGTLNRLTIGSSTIGGRSDNGSGMNDAINFQADAGSTAMNLTVSNSALTTARANLVAATGGVGTNMDVQLVGNTVTNNHPLTVSGGTAFDIASLGNVTFNIANNTFDMHAANGGTGIKSHVIEVNKGSGSGNSIFDGTISGNTIGVASTAHSGSGIGSNDIDINSQDNGTFTIAILNNILTHYDTAGIQISQISGSSTINATVQGNTTSNGDSNAFTGLYVVAGSGLAGDNGVINLLVGGSGAQRNDFSNGDPANGSDVFLAVSGGASTSTINLSRGVSGAPTAEQVVMDNNLNPATTTVATSGTVNLVNTVPPLP